MSPELRNKRNEFLKSFKDVLLHCSIDDKYYFFENISFDDVKYQPKGSDYIEYRAIEAQKGEKDGSFTSAAPLWARFALFNRDNIAYFSFWGFDFAITNFFPAAIEYQIEGIENTKLILKRTKYSN